MDDNFKSVRKNLNIISVLILLLAFSNAEINNLNFLGIDLSLEGEKIFIGLYVIYAYFVWRFLTKLSFFGSGGFLESYHKFLFSNEKGILKEFPYQKIKDQILSESEEFRNDFSDNIQILNRIIERNPRGKFNRITIVQQYAITNGKPNKPAKIAVNVSWLLIIRKFVWFCISYDKFGDFLFPLLPVLINLLFFFLNSDWQGSFYQLIH